MNVKHILLTTDLSPESLLPCRAVAQFARETGARITLLHVVEELVVAPHGAPLAPPLTPIDTVAEVKHAEKALLEQRASLGPDLDVEIRVATGSSVWREVVEQAKNDGVDLIALSTHGRTGFRHLAMGSVAESVLRHSPVPVLCFPQPKD
jgi:nucleotide-binding universal stress UspA family protein